MKYFDSQIVKLGDVVSMPIEEKRHVFKVIMIGDTKEHQIEDKCFLDWVEKDNLISKTTLVLQWLSKNPYKHNDPNFAPVADQIFAEIDEEIKLENRIEND